PERPLAVPRGQGLAVRGEDQGIDVLDLIPEAAQLLSRRHVPQADALLPVRGERYQPPAGGVRQGPDAPPAFETGELLAGGRLPTLSLVVRVRVPLVIRPRRQGLAVRGERRTLDLQHGALPHLQPAELLARAGLPEPDGLVLLAPRGECPAVRG